jgi:glycosyltransferase involved in cell wall biosynthesis
MRIGIDARYVYDHFPGIGRYIANLVLALGELEHGHTIVLITNPDLPNTRHDLSKLRQFASIEWAETTARPFSAGEQLVLPQLVRTLRLDLLHSPYYIKPYLPLNCPSVVTIYDLLGRRFPATLSRRGRLLYRLTMGLAIRTSRALITISQHAQDDLYFTYRIPRERIAVTPLATDRSFRPQPADAVAALRARYTLPERYVLYLGSNKPHKNLERLVRAWERVVTEGNHRATLLIAGHYDPHYPEARQLVEERGLSESVRFMPNVAEAELPALYSGALIFAFPSYYEGFGLPPLEAMACGAPVLCSYASSLPEVVGNAALTVDPYSFIEMAEGLNRLLSNTALRRRLSEQGQARARTFSWRRTALATLRVYEEVGIRD